jgi:hypothetical protein
VETAKIKLQKFSNLGKRQNALSASSLWKQHRMGGSRTGLAISMEKAEIHAPFCRSTPVAQLMQLMHNYPS